MNIFFLSLDVRECAEWMVDRHVVKMILEYCQLLCTAHRVLDVDVSDTLYKKTHVNHPCAKWVRESAHNYWWLFRLFKETLREYTYRYGKIHASSRLIPYLECIPENIPLGRFSHPPCAMPDEYKREDHILSYRLYYIHGKKHLHSWKKRETPSWINSCI